MTMHVTCNGAPLECLTIYVPHVGPWFAELRFVDAAAEVPQGAVTIAVGERTFNATILPEFDGSFAERREATAFGGAGKWQGLAKKRSYANDAGVKASLVVADLAREVGETLGDVAPGAASLGSHWFREAGFATRELERAIGTADWWVGYDGVTHIGTRATSTPSASAYQVLQAWPDRDYVKIGLDDVYAVGVGSILTERLPEPLTVASLEIAITPEGIRALCYTRSDARRSKLADAIATIATRATDTKLHGIYRYRVAAMSGDRADLRVTRQATGLPDALRVSFAPGVPGMTPQLRSGDDVFVQFADGLPSDPVITGFAGRGGNGFSPTSITLGGDGPTALAAYQGATVKVLTPPAVFQGTINGLPAVGAVVWPSGFTLGTIEIGTEKVKLATS